MAWHSSAVTKIAGSCDQPPSEVKLPDPVHHYAREERIVLGGDPVGQGSAPAGRDRVDGWLGYRASAEHRKETRWNRLRGVAVARGQIGPGRRFSSDIVNPWRKGSRSDIAEHLDHLLFESAELLLVFRRTRWRGLVVSGGS